MAGAFLKVVAGARQGLNVPLLGSDPLVIGRKRGDLIIDDPLVSSTHAQIIERNDSYVLQDLGSTNGTLVDGRLVRESVLRPGSEIAIGSTRLVLFVGLDEPVAEGEVPAPHKGSATEIAWLLDEELVELGGAGDHTASGGDVIDQDLRLPPGLRASVECVAGSDAGKVFRFTRGNVAIGRKTGEIPLTDLETSRRHAVIEVFGREMVFLRDLGSTNGTYHNGQRISVSRLRNGDTIGVGRSVLKLDIRN
jgi:pSer/pThr/pTyr-binding forkhead associated (FHA) protein